MSRWKRYQIKKQQRANINLKLDKAYIKIADLLMNAKLEEAESLAQSFLMKYPKHVKSWRLVDLVKAYKDVIGPTIINMKAGEKRKVLRAITLEYKTNDKISADTLANRLRQLNVS